MKKKRAAKRPRAKRPALPPLILASASPRRKELLKKMRLPFTVSVSGLFEPPPGQLDPVTYAGKLALAKADIVARRHPNAVVLGADTVVLVHGEILGKPADFSEACRMLSRLQGTTHQVVTGVALVNGRTRERLVRHAVSRVTMRRLTLEEIAKHARKHLDKAGAYAVQDKGDPVVKSVSGSRSNVVGLPVELLKKMLKGPFAIRRR